VKEKFYRYNKNLKQFSRRLRKDSTLSILWTNVLKAKRLKGYAFRRQRPIDKYVVDFFCKELRLIIELDGESHIGKEVKDLNRQKVLENKKYNIIRFKDNEIEDLDNVKRILEKWIEDYELKYPDVIRLKNRRKKIFPPPTPLHEGE